MDSRGQMEHPIIVLAGIIIGLLILGPILLNMITSVLTPFSNTLGNSSRAGLAVTSVKTTVVNFWDWVIVMVMLFSIVLMFISAFLVDAHPIFLVVYIFAGILLFIFAPMVVKVVDRLYDAAQTPQYAETITHLEMLDFVRNYFGLILLGIFFVTGVIMFGKIVRPQGGGG